jgi:hypothetical protein
MAYCKYNKDILASSNLKDIAKYCEDNQITYVTTMDFLVEAKKKKQLTKKDCNDFIAKVKNAGGKLPVNKIDEFEKKFKVRKP